MSPVDWKTREILKVLGLVCIFILYSKSTRRVDKQAYLRESTVAVSRLLRVTSNSFSYFPKYIVFK